MVPDWIDDAAVIKKVSKRGSMELTGLYSVVVPILACWFHSSNGDSTTKNQLSYAVKQVLFRRRTLRLDNTNILTPLLTKLILTRHDFAYPHLVFGPLPKHDPIARVSRAIAMFCN